MQEIKGNNNLQVFGDLNIEKKDIEKNTAPLTEHQWMVIKDRVEEMACEEYPIYRIFRELIAEFAVDKTRNIPSHLYSDVNLVLDKIETKVQKAIDESKDLSLKKIYIARIMNMSNLSQIQEYSIRKFGTSYFYNLKTEEVEGVLSYFEEQCNKVKTEPPQEMRQESFVSKILTSIRKRIDL